MNTVLTTALDGLALGEVQTSGPLMLIPILAAPVEGPDCISLAQAVRDKVVEIREINEGGSVPELQIHSTATVPILIIDGEELAGAKQNRAVNTSILVPAGKDMTIPVSCTEQGRWHYSTPVFENSDEVLAMKARRGKMRSVSENLRAEQRYASDQCRVWEDIADMQSEAAVHSPTGAMRDVYTARAGDFRERMNAFRPVDGQRGFVFVAHGNVTGAEFVSSPAAYTDLHDKLVRSYMSEHLNIVTTAPPLNQNQATAAAKKFIKAIEGLDETSFPGVGLGTEYRIEDAAHCAAALVHESTCIHFAAFADESENNTRAMEMRNVTERRRTMRRRRN